LASSFSLFLKILLAIAFYLLGSISGRAEPHLSRGGSTTAADGRFIYLLSL
jgi:hypothetical protein